MDTTRLEANYGNENLFLIGIIIIVILIIFYFLLKISKKNNKLTKKLVNATSEKTSNKLEENIKQKTSTNRFQDEQGINQPQNFSFEKRPKRIPSPILQEINEKIEEKPEHSLPKYIGYEPINIFTQTEPLHYPYVIMPTRTKCPIKFPQKGRSGRKGYKEDEFLLYIQKYFKETFSIYDDRYVLTKTNRYEPDFSLLNEKDGINIFLDIEIDEPYEGINDVNIRKATHFQFVDINRNNEFKNRGWIVIRFAEIQIHLNPNGCCRFIADVIKSIYPQFTIPHDLLSIKRIEPVQQWTKDIALTWSKQRYREKYLGINQFGYIPETVGADITIIQDEKVEEEIVDDKMVVIQEKAMSDMPEQNIVITAIETGKYVSFQYDQEKTIVKPSNFDGIIMTGYCYVRNGVRNFEISKMQNSCLKDNYCTLSLSADKLGIKNVANIMNIIIPNKKYVRMEYTRREWNSIYIDPETGELVNNKTEAETSIRTISNIQLDTERWGDNYIRAYCHKREAERTFYFARISLLEILDI